MTTLIARFETPIDRDTAYAACLASDLADEAVAALAADNGPVEVHGGHDGRFDLRILWLPYCQRAGIVTTQGTGNALWTDATSPDDAERRFADDDLNP